MGIAFIWLNLYPDKYGLEPAASLSEEAAPPKIPCITVCVAPSIPGCESNLCFGQSISEPRDSSLSVIKIQTLSVRSDQEAETSRHCGNTSQRKSEVSQLVSTPCRYEMVFSLEKKHGNLHGSHL